MSIKRGAQAETIAAEFLQQQGLRLIERNWHCRFGELDLVLREGACIVIVEVRMRSPGRFGSAADSIDRRKRARLLAAAQLYLARLPNSPCRFDVILMDNIEGRQIEWMKNAFGL